MGLFSEMVPDSSDKVTVALSTVAVHLDGSLLLYLNIFFSNIVL